ncbi:MAG: LOG family protein [Planctomycetota bacterium]
MSEIDQAVSDMDDDVMEPLPAGALREAMEAVVRGVGLDPGRGDGQRVLDIIHTAVKLVGDGANTGEMKLISRALKELRYALKVFRDYRHVPKVSIFGSARTPPGHPDYDKAVAFGRIMAQRGWMVITGAGDGIMKAGHEGGERTNSFGVSILLPFETNANDVIEGDHKLITFRYFFTRKLIFMWESAAVALFPGGFGTQDEGFEALTLVQTGKSAMLPIVMVDGTPGDEGYWGTWDKWVRDQLLERGWISPEDVDLYKLYDDPEAAADHVCRFYRNYHSARFVRDVQVLRLRRALTDAQVAALNERFGALVEGDGRIAQGGPLKGEGDESPELPRLSWPSTKRAYGELRRLIDAVNDYDAENHPEVDERCGGMRLAEPSEETIDAQRSRR